MRKTACSLKKFDKDGQNQSNLQLQKHLLDKDLNLIPSDILSATYTTSPQAMS
jgi:hypothetical protein